MLLNGTLVADDKADLTDGSLKPPINVDENLEPVSGEEVWTGTDADGTKSGVGGYCGNWDDAGARATGQIGNVDFTNATWTNDPTGEKPCNGDRRLYCFSDATSN